MLKCASGTFLLTMNSNNRLSIVGLLAGYHLESEYKNQYVQCRHPDSKSTWAPIHYMERETLLTTLPAPRRWSSITRHDGATKINVPWQTHIRSLTSICRKYRTSPGSKEKPSNDTHTRWCHGGATWQTHTPGHWLPLVENAEHRQDEGRNTARSRDTVQPTCSIPRVWWPVVVSLKQLQPSFTSANRSA